MSVTTQNAQLQKKRMFGLDVLRAVAILGVLISHSRYVIPARLENIMIVIRGGTLGVELFFVLSGFLIGTILLSLLPQLNSFLTLQHFWKRRWLRTLPNYYLFLLINLILYLIETGKLPNLFPYLLFLQNWIWPQSSFYSESWSLAVEEWFYLLFPLSIFLLARIMKTNKKFLIAAFLFLIIPSVLRVVWASSGHSNWDADFRKIVWLRLDALMYGVIAAWVKKEYSFIWMRARNILMITGVCILLTIQTYLNNNVTNGNFGAETFLFSLTSLAGAFLLPFCDQWQISRENVITWGFRSLALWSYSLYLINLPVVLLINRITGGPETLAGLRIIPAWCGFFFVSIVISAFNYRYFEKPMTDLRDKISIIGNKVEVSAINPPK
jgi:peptidoglycan/LPS O-acetylase OafA/YrhL